MSDQELRALAMRSFEKIAADWGLEFDKEIRENGLVGDTASATGIVFGSYLAGFLDGYQEAIPKA